VQNTQLTRQKQKGWRDINTSHRKKHAYKTAIEKLDRDIQVFEVGAQELVNLVEDGVQFNDYACAIASERLRVPLKMESIHSCSAALIFHFYIRL